eukprot:TRINITY_DN33072_c0_g1_i1.p1 TRINITY_DN33072_c0_g1~~TRINITY_DN33072_c0_g1_i1.p1  ORF type:complete len:373 (+),score=58.75 TRINITY_DN33072_c0_g1_i1:111-1121(+)
MATEEHEQRIDCVIPAHEKDFETLHLTVSSIRRCCPEVSRLVVVSRIPWPGAAAAGVEHFDEANPSWPFRIADFDGCGCPPGWLFQQVLKLYAPVAIPGLAPNVLVCDADVVWLDETGVRFLEPHGDGENELNTSPFVARLCTFNADACPPIRSYVDLHRYDAFVAALLPGLAKPLPGKETAVCHHMLFQRDIVRALITSVEDAANTTEDASVGDGGFHMQPFWAIFRDVARTCEGRASEYEVYHAFARRHFSCRVATRALAFAIVADAEAGLRTPPPGVTFLVAHSHLRGLSEEQLRDREGVINGNVCAEIARRMSQGKGRPPELAELLAASGMF